MPAPIDAPRRPWHALFWKACAMSMLMSVLDTVANDTIRPMEGFIVMFGLPWCLLLGLCSCYAYASFTRR